MHYQPVPPGKDPVLWQIAQRRASFKRHFSVYVVINLFLWLLWFFTGAHKTDHGIPWPVWPTIGWGIGIFFQFLGAYIYSGFGSVEKEYEKIQNQIKP